MTNENEFKCEICIKENKPPMICRGCGYKFCHHPLPEGNYSLEKPPCCPKCSSFDIAI